MYGDADWLIRWDGTASKKVNRGTTRNSLPAAVSNACRCLASERAGFICANPLSWTFDKDYISPLLNDITKTPWRKVLRRRGSKKMRWKGRRITETKKELMYKGCDAAVLNIVPLIHPHIHHWCRCEPSGTIRVQCLAQGHFNRRTEPATLPHIAPHIQYILYYRFSSSSFFYIFPPVHIHLQYFDVATFLNLLHTHMCVVLWLMLPD